jgi:hypothetical protein
MVGQTIKSGGIPMTEVCVPVVGFPFVTVPVAPWANVTPVTVDAATIPNPTNCCRIWLATGSMIRRTVDRFVTVPSVVTVMKALISLYGFGQAGNVIVALPAVVRGPRKKSRVLTGA